MLGLSGSLAKLHVLVLNLGHLELSGQDGLCVGLFSVLPLLDQLSLCPCRLESLLHSCVCLDQSVLLRSEFIHGLIELSDFFPSGLKPGLVELIDIRFFDLLLSGLVSLLLVCQVQRSDLCL